MTFEIRFRGRKCFLPLSQFWSCWL
jgi:hypothetical protein